MASFEVDVLVGCEGCSSPPPYIEPEDGTGNRILPLHSKDILVGDIVQDEKRRQDEKTKLFEVPSNDRKSRLGRNLPLVSENNDANDVACSGRRERGIVFGTRSFFCGRAWPISKLRRVESELEELKVSSEATINTLTGQYLIASRSVTAANRNNAIAATVATTAANRNIAIATTAATTAAARIGVLEERLRVSDVAAAAATTAAAQIGVLEEQLRVSNAAAAASASTERASAARIAALERRLRVANIAITAADHAAELATVTAACKIELLEQKLLAQETIFEQKLAATDRIARLEERIYVAGLRAELNALKNPVMPGKRRNFSS